MEYDESYIRKFYTKGNHPNWYRAFHKFRFWCQDVEKKVMKATITAFIIGLAVILVGLYS